MPDPITRIIFRRGTEREREGLLLNLGEPGFAIDSKRLYIGDGSTLGGISVGTKFLGFYDFGVIASNIPSSLAPLKNDLVFDTTTNILYALTGSDFNLRASWRPVGINIQTDNLTIQKNIDTLSVKTNSLDANYFTVNAIGRGLERTGGLNNKDTLQLATPGQGLVFNGSTLQVGTNSISNSMLEVVGPNIVKGKLTIAGNVEDIKISDLANVLAPILKPIINPPYQPGVTPPRYAYANGIFIDNNVDPSVFSIDTNYAVFDAIRILFKKPLVCSSDITTSGNIVAAGTIASSAGILGSNGNGTRYISTGGPSGGSEGDIWLQY